MGQGPPPAAGASGGSPGSMLPTLVYVVDALVAGRVLYAFARRFFASRIAHGPKQAEVVALRQALASYADGDDGPGVGDTSEARRPVRVYMDGCFDGMHFGHANALRQAKALGDVLVVGINPEVEIRKHKGPPIMSDEERFVAVESVKWVDEVLTNVPYEVTPEFLEKLIHEHDIDIIVHGDDPCIGADGQDVYRAVKEMGRFRTVKRTEGVSSTDIVGRMLLCTRNHHVNMDSGVPAEAPVDISSAKQMSSDDDHAPSASARSPSPFSRISTFLPTTRRLIQFAGGPKAPKPGDKVVYCDGVFDLFHAGHIQTLRRARKEGDFLLVGIHDDVTSNAKKGSNFPIMNLHERTLSVLSCEYVDEVIIGAPWCVTEDMVTTMNISIVVHGTQHDRIDPVHDGDPYEVPKRLGIYREVESTSDLTVPVIVDRIVRNRDAYVARNAKKEKSEADYLTKHKVYVPEG